MGGVLHELGRLPVIDTLCAPANQRPQESVEISGHRAELFQMQGLGHLGFGFPSFAGNPKAVPGNAVLL